MSDDLDIAALAPAERAKRAAALRALDFVEDGMILGLGTGSTARWFVALLGESGRRVTGVPTSAATRRQAGELGIPLADLDDVAGIDLTVDGADEFDDALNLVKGGGGALLQEKIVAAASVRMVVISDASKRVARLGAFPLPVEVVRFGAATTARRMATCLSAFGLGGRQMVLRGGDAPFVTDEGHFIYDLHLDTIPDPKGLDAALNALPGVVETGLFCGLATAVVIGHADGSAEVIGAEVIGAAVP